MESQRNKHNAIISCVVRIAIESIRGIKITNKAKKQRRIR